MASENGNVQSLERSFAILRLIGESTGYISLSELSAQSGLAQPTIHRALKTLLQMGMVRQDSSRRYALGAALIQLGEQAGSLLGSWARPHLARVADVTGETANMAVFDNDQITYVAQSPGKQQMRMFTEVGRRVPAHRTAVGKAMMAEMTTDRVNEICQRVGMAPATEFTITTPEELAVELKRVKKNGFAVDNQEQEIGVICVAVLVPETSVPTAISISGPSTRMSEKKIIDAVDTMRVFAREISSEFQNRH